MGYRSDLFAHCSSPGARQDRSHGTRFGIFDMASVKEPPGFERRYARASKLRDVAFATRRQRRLRLRPIAVRQRNLRAHIAHVANQSLNRGSLKPFALTSLRFMPIKRLLRAYEICGAIVSDGSRVPVRQRPKRSLTTARDGRR